ncbi:hypothetical protein J2785_002789 [Burkholderia ambifaria]|nr:hypothetical protein [Burkholderia ambifaria]
MAQLIDTGAADTPIEPFAIARCVAMATAAQAAA